MRCGRKEDETEWTEGVLGEGRSDAMCEWHGKARDGKLGSEVRRE